MLSIVLSRIYTLRNQLIHGGATWNGSVNREQLRDCVNLMGKLVPLVIEVMMDHPGTLWGMPFIQSSGEPAYLGGLRTYIALLDEPGAIRSSTTKCFGYFLIRSLSFLLP